MRSQFLACLILWIASGESAPAAELPKEVYVVPVFHPACCGWLADWSTERSYCGNSYLDHLDRVRDDPGYAFALSEVPNMIAMLNFEPARADELRERIREGRVELVNAFFLEPTINISGGEALVKSAVEGIRWQSAVLGSRPRFAWCIDVTGTHEQMAQITKGLGLDALVYCRHNPTGKSLHWAESPDGSRVLAVSPGGYAEWGAVFGARGPLSKEAVQSLKTDLQARSAATPGGSPVLIFGGTGDYSIAPLRKENPRAFLREWKEAVPGTEVRFTTLGKYVDAVLPAIRSGAVELPLMRGGTMFSFNAFWIESPRAKLSFRRCEGGLQAAESLSSIASLAKGSAYPAEDLSSAWLLLLLNMDRNSLWGSAGGMVFQSERSWDVADRYDWVDGTNRRIHEGALKSLLGEGKAAGLFNPLSWRRDDPVELNLPEGKGLEGVPCQALGDGRTLCRAVLPSFGVTGIGLAPLPPDSTREIALPEAIETARYVARIDPATGALASLVLKPSMREILGGPANVVVAERPLRQEGDQGDFMVDRPERKRHSTSSDRKPQINVTKGPLATIVDVRSAFIDAGKCRRVYRFYDDGPRIDLETELEEVPGRTVVVAEFPLKEDILEVRRGIPYGFSHGAWSKPNPELHGWTKGIVPAVRWTHYSLAGGGGVALLDRGLTGRELDGKTPLIFLLNATDSYYGYPNRWLSGWGKRRFSYALVAHEGPWASAGIPRLAYEFNAPPAASLLCAEAAPRSFLGASENVIVEVLRRAGDDLEIRLAECLGIAGTAEFRIDLPHKGAARTDFLGRDPAPLEGGPVYRFPIRPQEIATLRLKASSAVSEVKPRLRWDDLVPEAKRPALNERIFKKGHPPRGFEYLAEEARAADSKAPPEDLERWRSWRFGLFIHWGPVSLKGTEIGWSRGGPRRFTGGTGEIPLEVYDNLYKEFDPVKFDAREWAAAAKAAGMKYLVFTTKHHDGFCEFDSALTDYKVTNSPFRRDVVKELAQACRQAGLALGFYYSQPDWHHPDFLTENHSKYIEYLHGQLRELCTRYGKVDVIFFDGLGHPHTDWDAGRLLREIRGLQPHIIINNRTGLPADYDTPEQVVGGFQTDRAWETCMTIGDQWAWKPGDRIKSLVECLGNLVRCAGGDGNFLFNVGPMPTGEIEPRQVERLKEIGAWLEKNGESIYATRGGPFRPGPWGAATHRGDTVYVHVLEWPGERLQLPGLTRKVLSASVLGGGRAEVKQAADEIELSVPAGDRKEIDTVLVLKLDGQAAEARPVGPVSLAQGKKARASNVYQNMTAAHGPEKALDGDPATRWATDSGVRQAWLEVDLGAPAAIGRAHLSEAYDRVEEFVLERQVEGRWEPFARGKKIGGGLDLEFEAVTARTVRLNVLKALDGPTIWEFQLFGPKKR